MRKGHKNALKPIVASAYMSHEAWNIMMQNCVICDDVMYGL
jgi:hypothetical protein